MLSILAQEEATTIITGQNVVVIVSVAVAVIGLFGWLGRRKRSDWKRNDLIERIENRLREWKLKIFADYVDAVDDGNPLKMAGVRRAIIEKADSDEGMQEMLKPAFEHAVSRIGNTGTPEQCMWLVNLFAAAVSDRPDILRMLLPIAEKYVDHITKTDKKACEAFKAYWESIHAVNCDRINLSALDIVNHQEVRSKPAQVNQLHQVRVDGGGGQSAVQIAGQPQVQPVVAQAHSLTPGHDTGAFMDLQTHEVQQALQAARAAKAAAAAAAPLAPAAAVDPAALGAALNQG